MNINDYYISENEKPLDRIVNDGGFCAIFRTIACIGDSLSSGEFETVDEQGTHRYYDLYEHSWGQYMARMTGSKVYNFSRGGMTAKEYCEVFADNKGFWATDLAAQAYIIAMGANDINQNDELGSVDDIDLKDWRKNKETFAGFYGQIIQRVREISPDSKIFLMTMPREGGDMAEKEGKKKAHAQLLYGFAELFDNTYVMDFHQYAPVYDKRFKEYFWFNGHMTPAGYLLSAKMTASYIDYIIRSNPRDFAAAGLIGTGIDRGV